MTLEGQTRVLVAARPPLSDLVRLTLGHGPFTVKTIGTTDEAEGMKQLFKPHLVIVDIDIHDGDPKTLIGEVVGRRKLPSIVLTDRGDLRTKLDAFEHGADDFLSVPLSPDELLARVVALVRRTYGGGLALAPNITVGDLEIDLIDRVVRRGKTTVRLTDMEQALLYLLASNPGKTISRETILDTLWGSDYVAESNLVDRHVRNLRVKLNDDWRSPRFIQTVPGKGYRFVTPTAV
jgi:two-component system phosphate regulon response regulator PhoB